MEFDWPWKGSICKNHFIGESWGRIFANDGNNSVYVLILSCNSAGGGYRGMRNPSVKAEEQVNVVLSTMIKFRIMGQPDCPPQL